MGFMLAALSMSSHTGVPINLLVCIHGMLVTSPTRLQIRILEYCFRHLTNCSAVHHASVYMTIQRSAGVDWTRYEIDEPWILTILLGSVFYVFNGVVEAFERDTNVNIITRRELTSCKVFWNVIAKRRESYNDMLELMGATGDEDEDEMPPSNKIVEVLFANNAAKKDS